MTHTRRIKYLLITLILAFPAGCKPNSPSKDGTSPEEASTSTPDQETLGDQFEDRKNVATGKPKTESAQSSTKSRKMLRSDSSEVVDVDVLAGEEVVIRHRFTGPWREVTEFSKVVAGCSCAQVSIAPTRIEPNAEAELILRYNSRGRETTDLIPFGKSLNDQTVVIPVNFRIKSLPGILIEPFGCDFGIVQGEAVHRSITVETASPIETSMVDVQEMPDGLAYQWHSTGTSDEGHTYRLEFSYQPVSESRDVKQDFFLVLKDYLGSDRRFRLTALAKVLAEVEAVPSRLFLGLVKANEGKGITTKLRAKMDLQVVGVEGPPWMKVRYEAVLDGDGDTTLHLFPSIASSPDLLTGLTHIDAHVLHNGEPSVVRMHAIYAIADNK